MVYYDNVQFAELCPRIALEGGLEKEKEKLAELSAAKEAVIKDCHTARARYRAAIDGATQLEAIARDEEAEAHRLSFEAFHEALSATDACDFDAVSQPVEAK